MLHPVVPAVRASPLHALILSARLDPCVSACSVSLAECTNGLRPQDAVGHCGAFYQGER